MRTTSCAPAPAAAAQPACDATQPRTGAYATDAGLLNPPLSDTEADRAARRRSERYKETLEAASVIGGTPPKP
jgi:hypothetical protein